jgi:hypothetical protein
MPIETTIWNVNGGLRQINFSIPDSEMDIEDVLTEKIEIIDQNLIVIGRQVPTNTGGRIDILALDIEGNITIIELKRDKTPRDVVAQVLDYASWIQTLTISEIKEIFRQNFPAKEIEQYFSEKLNIDFPEVINENHKMIVVSSELDSSTERILNYLTENFGVPINVVFFRYFIDGENKYLSRTWMVDPNIIEQQARPTRTREAWNQRDFYVSFGSSEHRNWDDARKYGFVSAGQGEWFSRTLRQLFIGARVFAYIPSEGYVGVGIVKETVVRLNDFLVEKDRQMVPILECNLKAANMDENAGNPELSEYLVRIDWIKTIAREEAYRVVGMFANQNTVCKLRNQFTLDKLYKFFQIDE